MNIQKLMQEAKKMEKSMKRDQDELEASTFVGTSSLVSISMKGNYEVTSVEVNKKDELSKEDLELLEDMILLATNDALKQIKDYQQTMMGKYNSNLFGMI